jgi:protocatechuate 3,4-dioxygenase beta subunit
MKIPQTIFGLILVLTLLTACGSNVTGTVSSPQGATQAPTSVPATKVPATEAASSSADEAETSPIPVPALDGEPVVSEEQFVLSSFPQPLTAGGEPLVLYGHVLDASDAPLNGYEVEIWQVDANGIYDHPGDSNTGSRDMGFQFYGTAQTDKNGLFAFRTVIPARYEPRPRHIHFKVKKDGAEVLTSQFYFVGDVEAAQFGPAGEMLLLDLSDAQDAGGNAVKLAFKDIVVDSGAGGNLALTPSQTEGPFYPVVNVAGFDNDLVNVQ